MQGRLTILLAAGTALAVLAGCGDDDDGPASLVPADTPAYFEAVVRPEGDAAESAEAALGKIIDSDDPGQEIITQIEESAAEDGTDFDYEADIEPWLGERLGIYPSSLAGESEVVLVLETTDPAKALEFISSQEDATGEQREYEGTRYELDADGDAFGIVNDFLVFGDEAGFKKTVDTSDGDDVLADSDEYNDSVDDLPSERLATLYAIPRTFIEAIPEEEIDPQGRDIILEALDESGDEPILGDLTASDSAITFELSSGGGAEVSTEESALVSELPAEAWLGLGFADIGAAVENGLSSIENAGIPGIDAATIREQLKAQLGINLDSDVINALGDGALFVQGTTMKNVGGALVIESTDPAASAKLLRRLQRLISRQADPSELKVQPLASTGGDTGFQLVDPTGELPQPIQVVQRGDRIVAGYGAGSIEQALSPQSGAAALSGSPGFTGAQEAVGDLGIDAFLSFAPVFQLAEASGGASDPDYQRAKPYLDSLDFLAVGSGSEEDRAIARFIVGLK